MPPNPTSAAADDPGRRGGCHATEVRIGSGQVPRRFERHVAPGRQVELGPGSLDGTLGGELHGRIPIVHVRGRCHAGDHRAA